MRIDPRTHLPDGHSAVVSSSVFALRNTVGLPYHDGARVHIDVTREGLTQRETVPFMRGDWDRIPDEVKPYIVPWPVGDLHAKAAKDEPTTFDHVMGAIRRYIERETRNYHPR